MNYIKTLNLPKLRFPKKANPSKTESKILNFWHNINIYEKIQDRNKNKSKFIIHTPPAKVSDNLNINDVLSMILKDITIKHKSMCGFNVTNINIWNCYTSAIEYETLKYFIDDKSSEKKPQILLKRIRDSKARQANFREQCQKTCENFVLLQNEKIQKLGIFANWDKNIITSEIEYETEIFKCFENLYNSGYLNRDIKQKYWCINCQSDVEKSEIEYIGHNILSFNVEFPIMNGFEELGDNVSILVWIGTPWTISANKPIAINPDCEYSAVETENGKVTIMASDVVDSVMQNYKKSNYKIIKKIKGKELSEIICFHPLFDKGTTIIFDKRISSEKGTGCVYNISMNLIQNNNIDIASLVNSNEIQNEYDDPNEINVFDPINPISMELERRGYLFSSNPIEQQYPHCLACKQPLIVRNNEHWVFNFNSNHLKQHTIKALNNLKSKKSIINRISNGINNLEDWGISRRKLWGIPIPVFYCRKCNHQVEVDEGLKSCRYIIEKEGFAKLLATDPNDILPYDLVCNKCEARDFQWEIDILNEDFISALSYRQIFQNQKDTSENTYILLESDKKNEKWIYLSILSAMALENSNIFNSVIINGPIKTDHKEPIQDLINKFGADAIRLCIISSDHNKRLKFDKDYIESISNIYKRFRNTFRYLLAILDDFDLKDDKIEYDYLKEIDKWLLHKLTKFTKEANLAYNNYQYNRVYHLLCRFLFSDISKTYISIIRRKLYTFSKWSSVRRSIQTAIYETLITLAKIIAPITPFLAEELWEHIPNTKESYPSVFMADFPKFNEELLNDELEKKWNYLLMVRSAIFKALENSSEIEDDIPNHFQASVTLYAHTYDIHSRLNDCADILDEVFLVSRIRLIPPDEPIPDDLLVLDGIDGISAEIRLANGDKCERCYIYSDTVGTNELYPTLCHKCVSILEGGAEYV
jgi:isoleucyl-tRNA synthetase